jgi:nitroreductase
VSKDYFDVVLHQRACRMFTDEPVDDDLVEQCLRAATHAPSAENFQPWVFVVIRDAERRQAIADLMRNLWREYARPHSEGRLADSLLRDVDEGSEKGYATAPVWIAVCGDASIGLEQTLPASVYPATQNLLLAANALGLGSAMTTRAIRTKELRALLGVPDSVKPMALVPLGWPARRLGDPKRLPLPERVHRESYGHPW